VVEVAVSDDVASQVAGVSRTGLKRIFADKYLAGLVREEAGGRRIYHSILSDYILW